MALVLATFFALFMPIEGFAEAGANKPVVLITGANRGIGLALARKFSEEGYSVIGTARKPESANELRDSGARVEQLDVTSTESVNSLKRRLADEVIDILINNAGISGHSSSDFDSLDITQLQQVFDVNSLGPLRVTQALMTNLDAGRLKKVISISSRMGSIESNSSGCCYGYRASKAALNNFNKSLSIEFGAKGYIFTVLHPGWVKTDMTSDAATYIPAESAQRLFAVIDSLQASSNGRFYDLNGIEIPW